MLMATGCGDTDPATRTAEEATAATTRLTGVASRGEGLCSLQVSKQF